MIFLVLLFLCLSMSMPPISYSAEEAPEHINVIYLKDGSKIKCDMGWIEGDTLVYRRYGGTMGIPLKTVNLDKTFKKTKEKVGQDTHQSGEFTIYIFTYNNLIPMGPWTVQQTKHIMFMKEARTRGNSIIKFSLGENEK